jgi:hypothetical protein
LPSVSPNQGSLLKRLSAQGRILFVAEAGVKRNVLAADELRAWGVKCTPSGTRMWFEIQYGE